MNRKQLAVLHVAKTKLGLSETAYRSALAQIGGVTSAKDLDPEAFQALMGYFEYLGFQPLRVKGEDFGSRKGMATFAQIELIRTIWYEWSGASPAEGLNQWLEHYFNVSNLRFLRFTEAQKVITALKAMKARNA